MDSAERARSGSSVADVATRKLKRLYWTKLDDLAHDIADLLTILEGRAPETAPSACRRREGTVYLAETSSDLKDQRDAIQRELLGHGYTVLPDRAAPARRVRMRGVRARPAGAVPACRCT